jgi:hypothetical protein
MKICILSIVNVKHMSMISLYTSYLEKNGIEYDIIYVDKYNEEENIGAKNIYRYQLNVNRNWSKIKKLYAYWKFKNYGTKIIKEKKYDFVIIWRTETALLFGGYLVSKLRGKYCINIRDYCFEKNPLVFNRMKKVIKGSHFTTISSDGFKSFLPEHQYINVHSFNEKLLESCKPKTNLRMMKEPIKICFIGYVRFFDIDKKVIDTFGNDSRFVIQYFGEGSQYLEEYIKEKQYKNVELKKGFKVEETPKLLERADVIHNLYGYGNIALDTAISTRYYYALYMSIPILVFKGTYMEELSTRLGIGYAVDKSFDTLPDKFYNWYHSIDYEKFKKNCNNEIKNIKKENTLFKEVLENTFISID